jgi:S-adenosylmethionine:tRNA ribosyltransferase-isomerase
MIFELRTIVALSTDLFDYELPERLIAQTPAAHRDQSRLLVVDRASGRLAHRRFADICEYLGAKDTLFRNAVSVLPARLQARRPTGGQVECFLVRPEPGECERWWCLVRPGKKLPVGATFAHAEGLFEAEVEAKNEEGAALVRFHIRDGLCMTDLANRIGQVPLPPYIARQGSEAEREIDIQRYQTVYADPRQQKAVAAPTAGLHFTKALLERLGNQGVRFENIHLHVGLGTFKPIMTDHIEDHAIHREYYEMPVSAQRSLNPQPGERRVAVGTTSVRAIEDHLSKHPSPLGEASLEEAGIFIHPPARFRGVDALVTNFHQPRSTLLCLLSAFLRPGSTDGIAWFKEIYAEAIREEYRFLSYGDAMLIL